MFRLEIETTNAAFDEAPHEEIVGILTRLTRTLQGGFFPGDSSGHVKDINGNTVGMWQYTPES